MNIPIPSRVPGMPCRRCKQGLQLWSQRTSNGKPVILNRLDQDPCMLTHQLHLAPGVSQQAPASSQEGSRRSQQAPKYQEVVLVTEEVSVTRTFSGRGPREGVPDSREGSGFCKG